MRFPANRYKMPPIASPSDPNRNRTHNRNRIPRGSQLPAPCALPPEPRTLNPEPSPAILPHMLAKLHTFSLLGIDALPVVAEVDVSYAALPKTVLVGLPEQAVKESIHRIERAIVNSGFMHAHKSLR